MKVSKIFILIIILVIWAIFSVGYIGYDVWSDFKLRELEQVYQQGRRDTVNALIQQAQKCEPFPVFSGEQRVNLINTDCLITPKTE